MLLSLLIAIVFHATVLSAQHAATVMVMTTSSDIAIYQAGIINILRCVDKFAV
jgi:hypothetical protein